MLEHTEDHQLQQLASTLAGADLRITGRRRRRRPDPGARPGPNARASGQDRAVLEHTKITSCSSWPAHWPAQICASPAGAAGAGQILVLAPGQMLELVARPAPVLEHTEDHQLQQLASTPAGAGQILVLAPGQLLDLVARPAPS